MTRILVVLSMQWRGRQALILILVIVVMVATGCTSASSSVVAQTEPADPVGTARATPVVEQIEPDVHTEDSHAQNMQSGDHAAMHAQMFPGQDDVPVISLSMAGNDAFGAVQEVTAALRVDDETDWAHVDLEALRRHLVDMENMTLRVDVIEQIATPMGVHVVVAPYDERAAASLQRVFSAHPSQLAIETGWTMSVVEGDSQFAVNIETNNPDEVEMIQGLGYIGVMAIGNHHRTHHWMIATGNNPHE